MMRPHCDGVVNNIHMQALQGHATHLAGLVLVARVVGECVQPTMVQPMLVVAGLACSVVRGAHRKTAATKAKQQSNCATVQSSTVKTVTSNVVHQVCVVCAHVYPVYEVSKVGVERLVESKCGATCFWCRVVFSFHEDMASPEVDRRHEGHLHVLTHTPLALAPPSLLEVCSMLEKVPPKHDAGVGAGAGSSAGLSTDGAATAYEARCHQGARYRPESPHV